MPLDANIYRRLLANQISYITSHSIVQTLMVGPHPCVQNDE